MGTKNGVIEIDFESKKSGKYHNISSMNLISSSNEKSTNPVNDNYIEYENGKPVCVRIDG